MRAALIASLCGCSATTHTPAPAPRAQPIAVAAVATTPAAGTWRVDLEYPHWQARPSAIAVDETGVYITGPVFEPGNVEVRRWGIAKLDRATGAPLWAVLDNPANGPMPEHLALGGGALIVAGHESNYAATRALVFERRDPATGALLWRRTIPETSNSKYSLGGIALQDTTLLYAATLEGTPLQAAFGELALDSGKPVRVPIVRNNRRGRHIAADKSGVYLLSDDVLEKLDRSWKSLSTTPVGSVLRLERDDAGLVAWFRNIEQHDRDGTRRWTSKLVGDFVDVAVDGPGIYVCAMMDASSNAYFALAKIDLATGDVEWATRTAEYAESRPTSAIAVDDDSIYLLGYVGDRWYVERRQRSDGALGAVTPALHALEPKAAPELAR